jgi:hypothetical protein
MSSHENGLGRHCGVFCDSTGAGAERRICIPRPSQNKSSRREGFRSVSAERANAAEEMGSGRTL